MDTRQSALSPDGHGGCAHDPGTVVAVVVVLRLPMW